MLEVPKFAQRQSVWREQLSSEKVVRLWIH
jgi:hypothetical protein